MPVIPIPLLFPIPTDEDDFEDLCVDLLREFTGIGLGWSVLGGEGQRQFGIDILDLGGQSPLHAAQCKLREYGKTLSPTTISEEVNEARKFQPALWEIWDCDDGKGLHPKAQTRILEINQAP